VTHDEQAVGEQAVQLSNFDRQVRQLGVAR
jgi:hypothetical protein